MEKNKHLIQYKNNKLGIMSTIEHNNEHYFVKFYDLDSGESLNTIISYPYNEDGFFKATRRAMDFIS